MSFALIVFLLLSMDSVKTGYCDLPGTSLYYEISGEGTPVVFLHGNPSDLSVWDSQIEPFTQRYKMVRYDLRGFGRSKPSSEPYSHAEDLKFLLDCLGFDRVYLVGWSMGGGAVVNFALSYPERVKAMVLVDSSLGGYPYSEEFKSSYAVFDGSVARQKGLDAALEEVLTHPLFAQVMKNPQTAAKFRAMVHTYSGWHWFNKDSGVPLKPPAYIRLEEIKLPTLVMYGELDIPDFVNISSTLARRIPGSKLISFKNAGHCLPMEVQEAFNLAVFEFLRETDKREQANEN
jgi:3-oxoadipate enol-lactonase